ncbi:hypothetical protein I3843_15G152600 [Carya illinoinensis]|nr:hypothetical protein I3843_15G152600 [Carya illinoinensis]
MASSTAADPAKDVSSGDDAVKAGYWFCTSKFPAEDINADLFTHLYAGFAKVKCPIQPSENIDAVIQFPDNYRGIFENFPTIVKKRNPGVKALLSIGGGGPYVIPPDRQDDISKTIAAVARDEQHLREPFIKRSIELARRYNYDGLDLCWLYPSDAQQEIQLVSLLKAWRVAVDDDATNQINKPKLLLTATVFHKLCPPAGTGGTNCNYPFADISASLDWMNVLAVDFYDPFKSTSLTGPVHAWLNPKDKTKCGKAGIENWIAKGVASKKLVLGLPFYGYQWTLAKPSDHGFFAPASSALSTEEKEFHYLDFKSIQSDYVKTNPNNLKYSDDYVAAYWYYQSAWIGFDEEQCITTKVKEAKEKNLRGYFAWHVGADDDKFTLSTAAFEAWPPQYEE